jgi:hypothetical protein
MENTIKISPHTGEMKTLVEGVRIKNEFIGLGFTKPSAFIEIVQDYLIEFKGYKSAKLLHNWWHQRCKGDELNEKLNVVLNKLRNE